MSETMDKLYSEVKSAVAEVMKDTVHLPTIKARVYSKLNYRLRYQTTFNRFVKQKYWKLGLQTGDNMIVDKMIEFAMCGKSLDNKEDFQNLQMALTDMDSCLSRAKAINRDCDAILSDLSKIHNFMDTGKWEEESNT